MAVVNKPQQRVRVGMKLTDFSAGGVLPEGDYEVKESSFVLFQYTNKAGESGATTVALRLMLQPVVNGKAEGDQQEQIYSAGDPSAFVPSEDGNFLEGTGSRTSLSKSSKYYIQYESLVNAGLPEDKYEEAGAGFLVGMVGHIVHIPAPDYSRLRQQSAVGTGAVGAVAPKERKFPETIPVFKTIITSPWDKSKKPAAPKVVAKPATATPVKANGAPAPATVAAVEEGADNRLAAFLKDVVTGNGGTINRTQARLQCHRRYNSAKIDAAERDAELAAFNDDTLLTDLLASVNCYIEGTSIMFAGE